MTRDTPPVHIGNAAIDGTNHRGWIVGHFLPEGDLRCSSEAEIKWGVHRAGEARDGRQEAEHRTTVVLLVSGRFEVLLDTGPALLERQGDYAIWGRGVGHSWRAIEDSVVLTIRWPSQP